MSNLVIKTVTISLEVADKEYGNGTSRFFNLKGSYQDGGVPLEEIGTVVDDSLILFSAAWKSLLGSKFAQGMLNGETLKGELDKVIRRTEKVRQFLNKGDDAIVASASTPSVPAPATTGANGQNG